jgi:methyl-accepting chemotaxis protein
MGKVLSTHSLNKISGNSRTAERNFEIEYLGNYLRDISSSVSQITQNSEQEFLEIGGKLQSFLTNSRQLSSEASIAASGISANTLSNGITEINWMLKKFSDSLMASANDIKEDKEELSAISSHVELILDGLDGFKKITRQLRMLGISTKIESSRLGDDDKGFNTLAENVEKLSNQINDKVVVISQKATFLLNEINKTTKELKNLEKDQNLESDAILNNTKLALEAFEDKYNQCSLQVGRISQSANSVSKNISEVVTLIQFHDITRQQMEHVHEALESISEQVNYETRQGTGDGVSNEKLGKIRDICELQSDQLANSSNEFVGAVENIVSRIKDVGDNVNDIFSDIVNLLGDEGDSKGASLGKVNEELSTILASMNRNNEIGLSLANSIKSIVEIVEDLSEYVFEIEEIGSEIEIIALNARIKAAHTGMNGLSLGVLAESIQRLSIDAKSQTVGASQILLDIRSISKSLKTGLELANSDNGSEDLTETNARVMGLINSIIGSETDAKSSITKLKLSVNSLKEEINATVEGIKIHRQTQAMTEEILNDLDRIGSELIKKVGKRTDKKKSIDGLETKYTMDSEREIHKKFSNKEYKTAEEKSAGTITNSEDNFGDNVDLF